MISGGIHSPNFLSKNLSEFNVLPLHLNSYTFRSNVSINELLCKKSKIKFLITIVESYDTEIIFPLSFILKLMIVIDI